MRFVVQQKFFSIRDGFHITNEMGQDVYFVQGKIFTLGKQFTMYDSSNREVLFIKQRLFRLFATYDVYQGGNAVARIKRKFPLILAKRYKVTSDTFGSLRIKGNVFAFNFAIVDDQNREVARVSKKLLKIRDTYTIDVYDDNLEEIVLALTIIIDAVHHKGR